MNGRAPYRLLAAILVLIATLAVPGEALAHGYAHLGEAEGHAALAAHGTHGPIASDHDEEHPHPDTASAARWGWRAMAFAVAGTTKVPLGPAIATPTASPSMTPARHPGDPWSGPPPRVRAPPHG